MATLSSILAWEIPWTEESGGLQSMGTQKSWTRLSNEATTIKGHISLAAYQIFVSFSSRLGIFLAFSAIS